MLVKRKARLVLLLIEYEKIEGDRILCIFYYNYSRKKVINSYCFLLQESIKKYESKSQVIHQWQNLKSHIMHVMLLCKI